MLVSCELQWTIQSTKLRIATHYGVLEMANYFQRHRRRVIVKALKQPGTLFALTEADLVSAGSRL